MIASTARREAYTADTIDFQVNGTPVAAGIPGGIAKAADARYQPSKLSKYSTPMVNAIKPFHGLLRLIHPCWQQRFLPWALLVTVISLIVSSILWAKATIMKPFFKEIHGRCRW